jgi:hypothetical protein
MPPRDAHITDDDLLRAIDGEIERARLQTVEAHLSACAECRSRRATLCAVGSRFSEAHHRVLDARIPPDDGPRAVLKARLQTLANDDRSPARAGLHRAWSVAAASLRPRRAVSAAAALLVLSLLGASWLPWTGPTGELEAFVMPDARLTPGAAAAGSAEFVCAERREADASLVSRGVALTIFRSYGIAEPRAGAYELDFLIAPELGGATDASNLWPQPYAGVWNARLKDALEDHLYELVCSRRIDLRTAQHAIAADWVAAYRKYFETDSPLPAHQRFRKDHPWR